MALSELYQVQYTYGDYDKLAYSWGDANHPSTYQSFATTGKGLIDQSIFMFTRPNDAWSLGAYCTTITKGADVDHPRLTVTKNRLSKNNVLVSNDRWIGSGSLAYSSYAYIRNYEYSPQPTMTGLQPWINYAYNRFCLLPSFGFINPDTGQTSTMRTYNEAVAEGYTNWYVTHFRIERYNEPSAGSIINPMCIQFAGRMNDVELTPSGHGGNYLTLSNDVTEGVFYIPLDTGKVLDMYAVNGYNEHVNPNGCTNTVFWDLTQMDTRVIQRSSDSVKVLAISFDDVIKMVNRLGFYWAKEPSAITSAKGINCTDPNLVCAVIDPETHMVTDTVLEGTDIAQYAREHLDDPYCNFLLDYGLLDENNQPIGLDTEEYRENFNPEQSTVEPTDEIDLNIPTVASTGGNTLWLMSQEKLEELFLFLWDPNGTIFDDIVKGAALFGENPMDSVVSLKLFPFDISQVTTSDYRTMHFGRSLVDPVQVTNTKALTSSNLVVFDLGSFVFNDVGMFNDFRDYEPYSDYSLYIPFCGVVPLQAVECINTTISIKMIVDLIVGSATAVIFTNGIPYMYVDGNIGIDLPVTGRNCAELARTVLAGALAGGGILSRSPIISGLSNAAAEGGINFAKNNLPNAGYNLNAGALNAAGEMGFFGSKAQAAIPSGTGLGLMGYGVGGALASAGVAVGGVAVAGVIGAAPFIAGAAAAALTHNAPPQSAGCNAPATGLAKPLYPYFIVRRSDSWLPENYTKLYGRPLQEGGKVSDFAGFCTFGNINTDGLTDMTYEEKIQISELLQKGVII